MAGDILLVHVQDGSGTFLRSAFDKMRGRSYEQASAFRWILNVYVPFYPELRTRHSGEDSKRIPFPRQGEIEEVYYSFKERIGRFFQGWTEMGQVATAWHAPAKWTEPIEFRWIYEHILIATNDHSWPEKLLMAEAECDEAFLVLTAYYNDMAQLLMRL